MKLQIQSINFDADRKLIDFLQKKMDKLDTFFDNIIDGDVYLKVENDDQRANKHIHIQLNLPNKITLNVKEQAGTFEEAIDVSYDNLARQLKKTKEKMSEHR
jgi:putative sigma-54 modulation protein